jgi:tRNA threonylcarbamoyladenosine biosynthesis protein TsaE
MQEVKLQTNDVEQTISLAEQIGSHLKGGEIIELSSDLGGGKTTFVKGLIKGAGSLDTAKSPSFTLQNEYEANDLVIHHLDFYRLDDAGIMNNMLDEVLDDPKAVTVIEWAGIVNNVLPEKRLRVEIVASGENERQLKLTYPKKYNYLVDLTS